MRHPAYPTENDLRAEEQAELRDERDAQRLAVCADICHRAIDALIPMMGRLEHPYARWCPDDLVTALQEQVANIKHEQRVLTGAVVIDEQDEE